IWLRGTLGRPVLRSTMSFTQLGICTAGRLAMLGRLDSPGRLGKLGVDGVVALAVTLAPAGALVPTDTFAPPVDTLADALVPPGTSVAVDTDAPPPIGSWVGLVVMLAPAATDVSPSGRLNGVTELMT